MQSESATNQNENSNNIGGNEEENDAVSQRRAYIMKRARKWEFRPVKIANVWDFADDIIVHRWVRGKLFLFTPAVYTTKSMRSARKKELFEIPGSLRSIAASSLTVTRRSMI